MNGDPIEILLVEDNPYDVELTLRALRQHNVANKITVAKDGVEALAHIFGPSEEGMVYAPKIVLLDLKLPKINGIEVLQKIKSDERTKTIPVIMLTSSQEDIDLQTCYQLGANSYIVKPVDFDQFVHAVSEISLYWLLLNKLPNT